MSLNWNEINTRAVVFVNEWKDKVAKAREEADAQTFETGFLNIFGVTRSQIAIFEHKVKLNDGSNGYIDLFWKGHILIEMKSPGKDMQRAYQQAKNYANALPPAELPKGILICDFVNFHYYDLTNDAAKTEFQLSELPEHTTLFSDIAGYREIKYREQEAVNIRAAETMGKLHDRMKETGFAGHQLELYLVRLLFCLFAEDTEIFELFSFQRYIEQRTNEDGSDLAMHIAKIFQVLDNPKEKRLNTLDKQLATFPYINGGLFIEQLSIPDFDSRMRETLLECCRLDWSKISPAIFGAMFQSVMNAEERHDWGAHYTSEENILKLIRPLFLDELWDEFDKLRETKSSSQKQKLQKFHEKLSSLKFFDPACGCGNFLVITYRELRILELEVITELYGGELKFEAEHYVKVNVNQFYGIEIEEFPSQIAQTAMWLVDHQMNLRVRDRFGQYYARIPLKTSPTIICGNALKIDWETIIPKTELNYILGNPPFLGARIMSKEQKQDVESIFSGLKNCNNLDYVTCWYRKSVEYIQGTNIECAFVSTNSICQGEQVPILWTHLMNTYGLKINFAHQTFKWSNEAKGKAAVHCIIVGFSLFDRKEKFIFTYENVKSEPQKNIVKQINAYLIDAPTIFIEARNKPLCKISAINYGSMSIDNGHLILSEEEYEYLLHQEPDSKNMVKTYLGGDEFINNKKRFCLWLQNINPEKIKCSKFIMERIRQTREFRESSGRDATKKLAKTPTLFGEIRQPDSNYLIIPKVSSENRVYVPIGFLSKNVITNGSALIVPNATLYEFGILTSSMHNTWMRYVCGRLKSDYQYSASIVYNNFIWVENITDKQKLQIEKCAQQILDTREKHPDNSLADLYDPLTMPRDLLKAHQELDKAVDKAYGKTFPDDSARVAFLFERYKELTKDLLTKKEKKKER
jgi:hypothetical protein